MLEKASGEEHCEYYLKHKGPDLIGDNHVFLYDHGKVLMCDNYNCKNGNNSGEKFLIEGEKPEVGVCLSKGLKKIVEAEEAELLAEEIKNNQKE